MRYFDLKKGEKKKWILKTLHSFNDVIPSIIENITTTKKLKIFKNIINGNQNSHPYHFLSSQ